MNTRITSPKLKPPSVIESERIILRKPRIEDAETIYLDFAEDEDLNRYMHRAPSIDLAETCRIIARFIKGWETSSRFEYVIESKASGKLLGIIGIHNPDETDSLAYAISKESMGQNFLTEAVNALMNIQLHLPVADTEREPSANEYSSQLSITSKDMLALRFERTLRHRMFNANGKRGIRTKTKMQSA